MNGNDIVIVSATRTAIGKFGGQFATTSAIKLGTAVAKSAIQKAKLSPDQIDTVIFGNVLQAGLGQNPARQVGLKAGLLHSSTALTVNEVCGSGLKAIILAAQSLRLGDAKIVLAGGMENMSLAPHLLQQRFAPKNGFTREELDAFALSSQQKAAKAQEEGHFAKEITPVAIFNRKTKSDDFKASDEFIRANTTLESLSGLKPAFKKDGVVTAGNSSGINDGAACVIMTTREYAQELNLPILATLKGYAEAGVDPAIMGIGPVPAIEKLVARTRIPLEKVDIFELNEAFAAQSMAVIKDLKLPTEKVNPFGGAIALGHPIGASGTRIVVTLINALEQLDGKLGVASLCVGGGMGVAIAIEREK